jgi:hypothetical protein
LVGFAIKYINKPKAALVNLSEIKKKSTIPNNWSNPNFAGI